MTINEYLKSEGVTQAAFGKKVGKCRDTVARWLRRDCFPTRKTAARIVKHTKGAVTLLDIYG
jgi:transcriptional regulator with XRE-family HTH domain